MIEISGVVTDASTGEGIPGATLAINGQPAAAADNSGHFTLQVQSTTDQVTVSDIAYQPVTVPAYSIQANGVIQLYIDPKTLQEAVVTPGSKKVSPWWILAGVAVVASTHKPKAKKMGSSKSSNLIPLALLGVGAYLVLKPKTSPYPTYPAGYPYPTPTPTSSSGGSILSPGGISSVIDIFKGLFGGSGSENSPSGTYSSYDPTSSGGDIYAGTGMGATTTVNAGDIIGKTLIAAMRVPVYDDANDSAQPSGYISAGQPVGIVSSYLSPNPSLGRSVLWWMFEPLPGNSDIGNDQGFYFAPHNPDYYNFQALADAGVLTVAQATALKNGTEPSTFEKLLDKYVPWVIGGLIAVGIGKAVINKAL